MKPAILDVLCVVALVLLVGALLILGLDNAAPDVWRGEPTRRAR
jgi:hypothetical protein